MTLKILVTDTLLQLSPSTPLKKNEQFAATANENNTRDVWTEEEMELETKRHRVLKPLQFCSGIMTSDRNNAPPTAYLDKPTPNICTAEANGKSALLFCAISENSICICEKF